MRSLNTCLDNARWPIRVLSSIASTLLSVLILSSPALGLDPTKSISQYVYQKWGPDQGFLGGTIYSINQSADGYLWIGTDRGLVRFNGSKFDLIQQPVSDLPMIGRVRDLESDNNGDMWIRLEGAHTMLYRKGQFEDAFQHFHIPEVTITAMSTDERGHVLLADFGHVALRSEDNTLRAIANAQDAPGTVISLAETRDGRIWMGTRDNGLLMLDRNHISRPVHELSETKINALLPSSSVGLWIGTDRGIRFLSREGALTDNLPSWTHRLQILTMITDRDHNVWAGTDQGLLRISPSGQVSFRTIPVAQRHQVGAVFEDREGCIWYGGASGLERLQDGIFTTFSSGEGVPASPVGPVYADNGGGVWFAPLSGGLYLMKNHRVQQIRLAGLEDDIVYSVDGRDKDIWIGRQRGGLTHIRDRGTSLVATNHAETEGLAQNSVYAVHLSSDGAVWAGTVSGGVSVLRGTTLQTYSVADGLSSNAVKSIVEDKGGTIFVGTSGGLDEFRHNTWYHVSQKSGSPLPDIRTCFSDSQGVIWVVSASGLSYLKNGLLTDANNLPPVLHEQIFGIAEDRFHYLWFLTSDHLLRVNRQSILSGSQDNAGTQVFSSSDGLLGIQGEIRRERSIASDAIGRVWIAIDRGLSVASPTLTARDSLPIRVRVDSVYGGSNRLDPSSFFQIPAGTRSMTFHFETDSLSAPDRVRFRYRLEGVDPGWSAPVDLHQVSYSNLGPGLHRFHVMASRDGAFWNSDETEIEFSIVRAYWQTIWFRTAGSIIFILMAATLFHLRNIRLARQLTARFQERLSERTRIAQELHDTLLQSFQGLMLRFQTVDNMLPARPEEAKQILGSALDKADKALSESREAIQNIRSFIPLGPHLPQAISLLLAEVAREITPDGTNHPSSSVVVEGSPRRLNSWVESEVQSIARESLRNAFKHSKASQIEIEVTFEEKHLGIRFRDDGVGIDPTILRNGLRSGHWGMVGMKERAARIGATLEIWSKPGAGTELDLTVPGHVAYDEHGSRTARRDRWMSRQGSNDRES